MDLIDEYIAIVEAQLDAPKVFIESSAYYLVSAVLGPLFYCSSLPGGKLGARPNLWFILSSIPGRTRRSTINNYCQYVYKNSLVKIHMSKFGISMEDARKNVNGTILEEGTPEGLVDHIQETGLETYTIVSTEFGSVLQRMATKDYELGISTLYSKMYYGEPHSMMLSQRGKEAKNRFLKSGLYVTMFCGMQEAVEYMTRTMSRQGLLRRILLVACLPSEITRWAPPLDRTRENTYEKLWKMTEIFAARAKKLTEKLETISASNFNVVFHPAAETLINEVAKKYDDALTDPLGVTDANIYMQSFWEHLAKLSMICAISRDSFRDEKGDILGWVEKKDVLKALDFLERATKHNRNIISNLDEKREKIISATHPIEKVFEIIKSEPKGIVRSELYRRSGMTKKLLETYIETLVVQERIEIRTIGSIGRPLTIYKII
jgi:hypothetical protein